MAKENEQATSDVTGSVRPGKSGRRLLLPVALAAIVVLGTVSAAFVLSPRPEPSPTPPGDGVPDGQYLANAAAYVSAANWTTMTTVTVEMTEFAFAPKELTLEAGKPYKLEIKNRGAEKHYFTAEEFYRSVALRKAQTSEGEYKAPYLSAVEVFPQDQADIYFVAVMTGTYELVCTITGHADQGMTGSVRVTGVRPSAPAPVLADVAAGPWVQNAKDLVGAADWNAMTKLRVNLSEFSFTPENLTLSQGMPYRIELNTTGVEKHYFTAPSFYLSAAFRKAQDSSAEIKAPYFSAVEVFPGKQVDLYLIPTVAGTYDSLCTITGHQAAGMQGHVVVGP